MQCLVLPDSVQSLTVVSDVIHKTLDAPPFLLAPSDDTRILSDILQFNQAEVYDIETLVEENIRHYGLPQTAVILSDIDPEMITSIIRAFKSRQFWPILATVTQQSRDMSLGTLLRHLCEDRVKENQIRHRLNSQPIK
jgi:hypothetical protein